MPVLHGTYFHTQSIQSCPTLCDLMDCSLPVSSGHGFLRQEYWSGLSCPPPRDLPDLEFEPAPPVSPVSAFQADSLPLSHQGGQSCSPARWIHVKIHIYKQSQLLMTFPRWDPSYTLPSVKQLSSRLLTDQLADQKGWLPNKRFWPEEQVISGTAVQQLVSLEKEMAAHSRVLAQKILWIEEPGRLQSMG